MSAGKVGGALALMALSTPVALVPVWWLTAPPYAWVLTATWGLFVVAFALSMYDDERGTTADADADECTCPCVCGKRENGGGNA